MVTASSGSWAQKFCCKVGSGKASVQCSLTQAWGTVAGPRFLTRTYTLAALPGTGSSPASFRKPCGVGSTC